LADANADVFGNQWVGPSEGIVFFPWLLRRAFFLGSSSFVTCLAL
jgi:hypothetical protein